MPVIETRGLQFYVEWHGPTDAPVLVLNNGVMMSTASWARQTPVFSKHYRVLLYDMRGQGQSQHPPGPYAMDQHADDLAALFDVLGIASAHVLGISYGGEVAQDFVLRHATRVRSLILADTVSEVGPELRLAVGSWIRAARANDADALFDLTVPWNFSPEFIAANPGLMADARRRYRNIDFEALATLCEAFQGVDFTSRLAGVHVPTCVVVGDRDRLKGPPYARIIHDAIRGSELHVIAGAGHAACWERPDEFNTIVLGFLAKLK